MARSRTFFEDLNQFVDENPDIGLHGISQILSYIEQCESEGDEFSKSHLLILEMLTQRISKDLLEINAEIDDILAQNKAQENDIGILTDFFETHPNILEKLSSVKTSKLIQVIEGLDVCFRNTEVELIDESLKQYIFDNNRYELNDYMICRVVQWRNPDAVQYLSKRNYTMMVAGYLRRTITDFYSCKRNDIISLCVLKQNNK